MSDLDRRQFLRGILGALAGAGGSVVLASAAVPAPETQAKQPDAAGPPPEDVQERADRLAGAGTCEGGGAAGEFLNINVNRPFLNGGWPNGLWRNLPWGNGWYNGWWNNLPWRNGWHNGIWRNGLGGWRNIRW
jgi:hypothetical protein